MVTENKNTVDIEVQVVKAREFANPHASFVSRGHPWYYVSLDLNGINKQTQPARTEEECQANKVLTWKESFVFSADLESTLQITVLCKHRYREDHTVGNANLDLLASVKNKELEVTLYRTLGKGSKTDIVAGFLTLRVNVAFSVIFNVHKSNAGLRSLSGLHQMDNALERLSEKELQGLPSMWIQLVKALDAFAAFAANISQLDSRANVTVHAVTQMIHILAQQIERDEKIDRLGLIMAHLYSYVRDGIEIKKITTYEKALERLLEQTSECAYFVAEYRKIKYFAQRSIVNLVSNADEMIQRFETAFGEVKIELILGSSLQTAIVSFRILQTVETIESLLYINDLPHLKGVGWDSGRTCLHSTRTAEIRDIIDWASHTLDDALNKKIYVLTGPVGCGKSAIANTIAQTFSQQKRLAASVFLNGHREVNSRTISSSIMYQIAHYDPKFMTSMADKLKSNVALTYADIGQQFGELLVEPVRLHSTSHMAALTMVGPTLIILDGLHEVLDRHEQFLILTSIVHHFEKLPSNFRLLVTSRQGDPVSEVFSQFPDLCIIREITHENDRKNGPHEYTAWILDQISSDELLQRYTTADLRNQLIQRSFGVPVYLILLYRFLIAIRDICGVNEMLHTLTNILSMPTPLFRETAMTHLFDHISLYIPYSEYSVADLLLRYIRMPQSHSPDALYALRSSKNLFSADSSIHDRCVDILQRIGLIVDTGNNRWMLLPIYQDYLVDKNTDNLTRTIITHSQTVLARVCKDLGLLTEPDDSVSTPDDPYGRDVLVYTAFIALVEEVAPDLAGFTGLFSELFEKLEIFVFNWHANGWINYEIYCGHFTEVKTIFIRFYHWLSRHFEYHAKQSKASLPYVSAGEDLFKIIASVAEPGDMDPELYKSILVDHIQQARQSKIATWSPPLVNLPSDPRYRYSPRCATIVKVTTTIKREYSEIGCSSCTPDRTVFICAE